MKRIYLASPYNLSQKQKANLAALCTEVSNFGAIPIAPALYLPLIMDITNTEKLRAVVSDLIRLCDDFWYVGSAANFAEEIETAHQLGIVITHLELSTIFKKSPDTYIN